MHGLVAATAPVAAALKVAVGSVAELAVDSAVERGYSVVERERSLVEQELDQHLRLPQASPHCALRCPRAATPALCACCSDINCLR